MSRQNDASRGAAKSAEDWALASGLTASLIASNEAHSEQNRNAAGASELSTATKGALYVAMRAPQGTIEFKLDDNKSSRDFASMLPLEATLEDYASTEKISYLPRKLIIQDAPDGYTPREGDMAYYAPWGNFAIFHKDFTYSIGLVKLGTLLSGMDILRKKGPVQVKMELVRKN
ncbi:hypothetical protein PMM47T1_06821 [Pseudomonas sp. M47T1]|uniref:cyclophilin-like fold protein n=1 Tax=Pseudomonas sp. M47T1 TaxID=1179778 RepID=UPI00026082A1|nr:cyclophilin-like fold protein [Pseudomonas sp. M47T1]EIK97477.1 hypothetical protein PMM47T1_06821 [Pseudomonas sp. M47T1]